MACHVQKLNPELCRLAAIKVSVFFNIPDGILRELLEDDRLAQCFAHLEDTITADLKIVIFLPDFVKRQLFKNTVDL